MSTSTGSLEAQTLPALLLHRKQTMPTKTALRHHTLGIWKTTSWEELHRDVVALAGALRALGVGERDVVALASPNCPEWIVADLAIQGIGAQTLTINPEFSPETVARLCREHGAVVAFAGDEEQHDKLEASRAGLPSLRTIVVINTRGIRHIDNNTEPSPTVSFANALRWSTGDVWTPHVPLLDPDAVATIESTVFDGGTGTNSVHTAGATSSELIRASTVLGERLEAHGGDELLPLASLSEPIERRISEVVGLRLGATLNIGEGGALTAHERAAVQPTIVHIPATGLHEMHASIEAQRAKRGIRRLALNRLLQSRSNAQPSRSAARDLLITRGAFVALVVATLLIHRLLVTTSGWIRLGIIGAMWAVVVGGLIIGGYAVRPFVRRAYGLAHARSLLTGSGLDPRTANFFRALHLTPLVEDTLRTEGSR